MSDVGFQFAVLRYVPDIITEEFINIGVVVYSCEARYLAALVNNRYARITTTFEAIDVSLYHRLVDYIERRADQLGKELRQGRLFDDSLEQFRLLLERIVAPNDAALQFGHYGGGLTDAPQQELKRLFERLVLRYENRKAGEGRTDDQVWKAFESDLIQFRVIEHLRPVTITVPSFDYKYEFKHAWKNDRWHPIEPVSFDLTNQSYIEDKAHRWTGRVLTLSESPELERVTLLLGTPADEKLARAFDNAREILHHNIGSRPSRCRCAIDQRPHPRRLRTLRSTRV